MILQLIKLDLLKTMRSSSFAKSVIVALFLGFLTIILLSYLLLLGIFLKEIIEKGLEQTDAYEFLSANLFYFFLVEFMYRYFTQQLPVIELERFLHLPIKKSKIINFLLLRSFISPLTLIAVLIFAPFAFKEIMPRFGDAAAWSWLMCILLTSWSLHWVMLWFKQKFEDSFTGLAVIFIVLLLGVGSNYYGWFNIGELVKPIFDWSLTSVIPIAIMVVVFAMLYRLAFTYYRNNAYLEDLSKEENIRFANSSFGILDRFGLAGDLANLEWKLII